MDWIALDKQWLLALNGSQSLFLASLVKTLTTATTWIPLYVALLYLVIKNSDNARKVLSCIRQAPHSVTLSTIPEHDDCPDIDEATAAVQVLLRFGLIKQDSRSRRAGHSIEDPDAMFFTVPEKRDITDQVVYGVI